MYFAVMKGRQQKKQKFKKYAHTIRHITAILAWQLVPRIMKETKCDIRFPNKKFALVKSKKNYSDISSLIVLIF